MSITQKITRRILRKAHHLFGDASTLLGFDKSIFNTARGSRILVYHGICEQDPTHFNTLFITAKTLEKHLQLYKKYFNVVSIDDYYRQRFSSDKFNICITFDDGFANNYKYALPLLEQYQLPATFFITAITGAGYDILWNDMLSIAGKLGPKEFTFQSVSYHKNKYNKYVDSEGVALSEKLQIGSFQDKAELIEHLKELTNLHRDKLQTDYWLQMAPDQIEALSASKYVTIGAHGYYHNDLSQVAIADVKKELIQSKIYLEGITGQQITSLAFPYGSYNSTVIEAAKEVGYSKLLGTDPDSDEDEALKQRLTINPFLSPVNQIYATIKGEYY